LANLPPQAGLYACLFSGLVFWIFCGSRLTSITVTSSISLVLGVSLAEIAGGDASRFTGLAIGTAFLVAVIAFIAWLAKAGVLVHFISETVMTGFKGGVDTKLGGVNRFTAVADVVEHFQREQTASRNFTTATLEPTETIP
jgi:MFS superfamily sulfate permease-like transporter